MPRYRTAGGLDDTTVQDGDVGYLGMNLRLPVWQLPAGMLSLSTNGRIEGDWTPRKGTAVLSDGVASNGDALRLPFWLIDTTGGLEIEEADRVGETVVLTITGHGLPASNTPASIILDPAGSNNSVLYESIGFGPDANLISVGYEAIYGFPALPVMSVVGNAVTITPSDRGRMVLSGVAEFEGEVGYIGDYQGSPCWSDNPANLADPENPIANTKTIYRALNGRWQIVSVIEITPPFSTTYSAQEIVNENGTAQYPDMALAWTSLSLMVAAGVTSAQQVIDVVNAAYDLVIASAVGDVSGGIAPLSPAFLQGGAVGGAYLGVEGVQTPYTVNPNGVWFITPTDEDTLEYTIPGSVGNESYDVDTAVVISRLNDFSVGSVLGSCLYSDPSSNNDESIFLAYGNDVKKVSLSDGSFVSFGLPGTETLEEDVSLIQAMDKVLLFRDGKVAFQWQRGDTDFSEVPDGTYTQPQTFTVTGTNVDVVSGACVISGITNNTVAVGDSIIIHATTNSNFTEFVGKSFTVFAATGTSFSFYIPTQDLSTIGTDTLSLGRRVSVGGGFIYQPAFPWAIYFQRRIWGPYNYNYGSPSFINRNIRDELIASDILDTDTYDPISNQFRITGGTADYIVALHPFTEDTLLVLNRNSIHQIKGTRGSLEDTEVTELTREIGCLARRSIVTQGNAIFFLSDSGVYLLEFLNDYNLRGAEEPLSKDIQPLIDRISQNYAAGAVGIYFNYRYWIAVPLDSSPGAGDSIGNNAILIYNLKNRAWESLDTFGDPNFLIQNLIIGTAEQRNDLYAVTSSGGIHLLDKNDSDYDTITTNPDSGSSQFFVDARMRTRGYLNGSGGRKRFSELGMQVRAGTAQCDMGITFSTDDPDNSGEEIFISSTYLGEILEAGESEDVRARVGGLRGFNATMEVRRVIGRGSVQGTQAAATEAFRSALTAK